MSEETGKKERHFNWLLTILISLLVSLASIFVYDRFFVQKIVAVDIKGYIAEQRDLYISGKLEKFVYNGKVPHVLIGIARELYLNEDFVYQQSKEPYGLYPEIKRGVVISSGSGFCRVPQGLFLLFRTSLCP
ncbi:MAG: hypothetical protein AB1306_10670 [Nitrospirota bacterium]